ncbi:hypothetical protein M0657_002950 [Pyricularia oryzae]|uniref:DUF7371 domain-containing protein n=2 Tax=Pyricularia oryzae TaxID=318829 RepID=A0AA97P1F8_PYRO3|nr:hypothetical protein OOU_Y34scaffold00448g26 [Pyricularia oryzae Y34]KAI7927831.1 hypothetical protein M0657_002950 [Pyricularia oryzae]
MRAFALVGALMSAALVLPAGAASQSTSNTTCDPAKTIPASVPTLALPTISSIFNSEIPIPTIVPVPDISVPIYGPDTSSLHVSAGQSSEDITTIIIRTGPAKTITRSLKRVPISDATSSLVTRPKSVAIPTLASVPDVIASEETAVGVPIAATMTTSPLRSGSTAEKHATTSILDLGSDSIVTISKSLGSDSFVEWTKTIALVPSLPDLIEPTSGDFTVSFGASTTMFFTPEPSPEPISSSLASILTSPVASPESSTGWETVWEGSPGPVETTLSVSPSVSSTIIIPVPDDTVTGVLGTSVEPTVIEPTVVEPTVVEPTVVEPTVIKSTVAEPTSTEVIEIPPPVVVPSISLITVPYSFPAYSPLEPSTSTTDVITSSQPSRNPATVIFTLPGDGLREPRVVTLTTNLPRVSGTPGLMTSISNSLDDVVVTYTMHGGYGHSSSVVTFTTSRPVSTKSHTKSSPSMSGSRSRTSSTKESITIVPYGPWPSPPPSPSKTTTSSSERHSATSVSFSTGGPRHTSDHGTGATPFTNSTISGSMSLTIASSGSGIQSSAVTSFPSASDSRTMPVGTGVSFSSPITSSGVTSMSDRSSIRRTTSRGTGISSSGDVFTSAVGIPFRPSPAPSMTVPLPGSSNITGTSSVVVPIPTGLNQPAQSSMNATASFSSNFTTAPLSGAGQPASTNSTTFGVSAQATPPSGPGRSSSAAPAGSSSSIPSSSSTSFLNSTLAAGTGVSISTRPSLTQGGSGASVPLETSTPITVGSPTAINATTVPTTAATTSTRLGQTQGGLGNGTTSSSPLATPSVSTPQEEDGTSISEAPTTSSTARGQTQAGPGVTTSLPSLTETAVGPVQSQNATLSLSASGNSTSSANATTAAPSTTTSIRGQGQGGGGASTALLSNTTSPETSTINQTGGLPLQSQDSATSANVTSGVDTSSRSTASRVGQTVGGPFPPSSTVPGRQTQGGAGEAPTTTNITPTNSSDTLTSTSGRAVQTQGGASPPSTAFNETTSVPSSARQPQSQGAAGTPSTATWPPMTTQSVNGTSTNSTSTGANSSSTTPSSSQGNAPAPTTGAPRSQGGQGGESTQTAAGNTAGNATLITQASTTASSVDQIAQSQTTLATVINPATNSTTAIPASGTGSPLFCGNEWDRGNETINFDDRAALQWSNPTSPMPLFVPYHRLYFSDGFSIVPPPNQTHNPSSGNNMTMWSPPNSSITAVGQIGFGPLSDNSCFRFNPLSFDLGCNTTEKYCSFNISGLRYDGILGQEQQVSQFEVSFPSCSANNFTNCSLTTVNLSRYNLTDLTSITFDNIGNSSRVWFGDDFEFAWTNDTCEAGRCRALVPNLSHRVRAGHFRSPRRALLHHESATQEAPVPLSASQWLRTVLGAA